MYVWTRKGRETMSLRRFFRLLRTNRLPASGVDDSLARTAKDAMHIRGGNKSGTHYYGTEAVYKHIAEGHKNYAKSFKKKD